MEKKFEFKERLSVSLIKKIEPISNEIKKLSKDREYLDKIILEGSQKANDITSEKIKKLHKILGF